MRHLRPLVLLALIAALFLAGVALRNRFGIEWSAESIRDLVAGLGWKGPAIFVVIVAFRAFLLAPSALVLAAGGVLFGVVWGTLLGALGIVVSALWMYAVARTVSRDWLRPRFGAAIEGFEQRAEAAGPLLVGLATAYPTGPMSPLHWGAGFASIPLPTFLVAVVIGAPIRAFAYAFFGASLLDVGTPRFFLATAILAVVAVLPLLHRPTRERILSAVRLRSSTLGGER